MKIRSLIIAASALVLAVSNAVVAKTRTVEGSSIFYIPPTMSRVQAEEEAIRRAKIDALNKAFGNTIVASSTSIITENDERFFSNGFDMVKGEWIETIGTPEVKPGLDGEEFFLSIKIKGKAREKKTAEINLSAKILRNCTGPNCESTEFKAGDKFYVDVVSPVDGYICIFQHDPVSDMVYSLLPYRKDGAGSFKIEHDKEYIFFSKSDSDTPRLVDEYRLGCSEDGEVNTIYIVFSTNLFSRTIAETNDRYTPRHLNYRDFEAWKGKCLSQDAMMQVISKNIVINK